MKLTQLTGVFHCFGGTSQEAERIMKLGLLMGIGGVLTYKSAAGLKEVLREIPLEALLLETDAPYLAPVPHRGKRNESAFVRVVAEAVAEAKGVSFEKVCASTTQNAFDLFDIY